MLCCGNLGGGVLLMKRKIGLVVTYICVVLIMLPISGVIHFFTLLSGECYRDNVGDILRELNYGVRIDLVYLVIWYIILKLLSLTYKDKEVYKKVKLVLWSSCTSLLLLQVLYMCYNLIQLG